MKKQYIMQAQIYDETTVTPSSIFCHPQSVRLILQYTDLARANITQDIETRYTICEDFGV